MIDESSLFKENYLVKSKENKNIASISMDKQSYNCAASRLYYSLYLMLLFYDYKKTLWKKDVFEKCLERIKNDKIKASFEKRGWDANYIPHVFIKDLISEHVFIDDDKFRSIFRRTVDDLHGLREKADYNYIDVTKQDLTNTWEWTLNLIEELKNKGEINGTAK